jgi:ubiquinone/menaquinone biosynthesis C-methylase UbiE
LTCNSSTTSISISIRRYSIALDQLDAKRYRKINVLQRELANEVWSTLSLRGDEHVLDIGCGDGSITAGMANELPRGKMIGIDPSEPMITVANELRGNNFNFELRNAHEIDEVETYDIVTAFSSLHWVPHVNQVVEHVFRALKPGGHFLIVTYSPEDGLTKEELDLLHSPPWNALARPSGLHNKTAAEYIDIFNASPWHYTLQEELRVAPLDEWNMRCNIEVFAPLLLNGTEQERQQFTDELVCRLRRPGKPFEASVLALKIVAQKQP